MSHKSQQHNDVFHSIDASVVDHTPSQVLGFLLAVVDSTSDAIITTDLDGKITSWNAGAKKLYGYKPPEILGKNMTVLYPAKSEDWADEVLKPTQAEDGIEAFETKRVSKEGEYKNVSITTAPLLNQDGNCFGMVCIHRNTTRWKAQELERNRLAAIVDSAEDAIIGKELDGTITSWNNGASKMYGYSPEEVIGRNISLIIPDDRQQELAKIMAALERGEIIDPHETQRIRKNGATIDVSLTISPMHDWDGTIVGASAIARDITKQKQLEAERDRALRRERVARRAAEQRQQQLEFLTKASEVLAGSLDYETTLSNVAKLAVEHIADWCAIDLVQENGIVRTAVEHKNKSKSQIAMRLTEEFRASDEVPSTTQKVIDTGEPILFRKIDANLLRELVPNKKYVDLILSLGLSSSMVVPLSVRGKNIGTLALISEDENRRYTRKDLFWAQELAHYAALAVEDARLYSKVKALNENLEHRVERRTEELERTNKELESFSYSVSHDLRAPLRAIRGFGDILMNEYSEGIPEEGKKYLQLIDKNIRKMGELIDDLLAYSRVTRKPIRLHDVDMSQIVHEVLEDLNFNESPAELEITLNSLEPGKADQALIVQVWKNLISNAIKYSKKQETPHIQIGSNITDGKVVYYVRDNGVGFDMRYADKLFEVFQRLHREEEYEGTGVGLAIVKHIVESHGGTIWAKSTPEQGSTFFFTLAQGNNLNE